MNAQQDAAPALRAILVDSSAAALELIESLPATPDLVIMELDLSDMDGAVCDAACRVPMPARC